MDKIVKRQDAGWKQCFGYSGETSINLSNDLCEYLSFSLIDFGEEYSLTVYIYKEDYLHALDFIKSQCPLYRSTSKTCDLIDCGSELFSKLEASVQHYFGNNVKVPYTITLYKRKDGRNYLKGLKQNRFTIRDFLVEEGSILSFEMTDDLFDLRVKSAESVTN